MTTSPAPLRADARRNRQRLVSVAAEAFAAHEPISLDAIARRAGVGPSRYRAIHFDSVARAT